MNILVDRKYKKPGYTIGKLYIDGEYFCDTLEDTDRGLYQGMPLSQIQKIKIPGETAVPTGTYKIVLNIVSPKFASKEPYKSYCGGKVPRLESVPGFDGVLVHSGNSAADTEGCLILGQNKEVGKVLNSQITWKKFYDIIKKASNISITIK